MVWYSCWRHHWSLLFFFGNDQDVGVSVTTERYQDRIRNFLVPEIEEQRLEGMWFQQDEATAHTLPKINICFREGYLPQYENNYCRRSVNLLGNMIDNISTILFCLLGYLQIKYNLDRLLQHLMPWFTGYPDEYISTELTFVSRLVYTLQMLNSPKRSNYNFSEYIFNSTVNRSNHTLKYDKKQAMDLSAYSLPRLIKEKRERQPNWTEHEKQLLLSLTRNHQAILENKGSDTMTLKRKSEAWNEIALHMYAAGYNRSKERLKQQLGRIRAAEAKKVKDAIDKLSNRERNSLNACEESTVIQQSMRLQIYSKPSENVISPSHIRDELHIKAERKASTDDESYFEEHNCLSPQSDCDGDTNIDATNSEFAQQLMLQNVQALGENRKVPTNDKDDNIQVSPSKTDFIPALSDAKNIDTLNLLDHTINNENDSAHCQEEVVGKEDRTSPMAIQKKRCMRSIRVAGCRTLPRKELRLRQIHLYRMAVERERLRALKIQQKRDRVLYRKDVQIQNLKLQILRNITNETQDVNRINL